MSNIRVTYSGLVAFVIGIAGVFTGLIYTVILTRSLSVTEFGTWNLVLGLIGYVVVFEPIISYWTTREVSRNIDSGRTALLSSGLLSTVAMIGYLFAAYVVGNQTNVDINILYSAVILIPIIFLNKTLTAINLGWKPHTISYGTLGYSVIQIPFAFVFLYHLDMGVFGVILSSIIAYVTSIGILGFYSFEKLKTTIKIKYLKKYFKRFWLPLYPGFGSMIYFLDVSIFSIITKSVEGVAIWAVCIVVPNIISQAALVSRAVYPKLLGDVNKDYLKGNITQLFYFSIPLTGLSIVFAEPALFLLNPIYREASLIVTFVSLFVFLNTLIGVFQSLLIGQEKVDVNDSSTLRDFLHSKLFHMPTITIIQYGIYIVSLTTMLLLLESSTSQLHLVMYWSIIAFLTQIPIIAYLYRLVYKTFGSVIDFKSMMKYLLISALVFGAVYFMIDEFLNYQNDLFSFVPLLLLLGIISIGFYIVITYVVDFRTKQLVQAILKEIKH